MLTGEQNGGSRACPRERAITFRNGVDRPAGWTCLTLRRNCQLRRWREARERVYRRPAVLATSSASSF